jgi:plasmid stability protein
MSALTIRKLDPSLKTALRMRAARHGHSMEEEARQLLRTALETASAAGESKNLLQAIRDIVEPIGGLDDLELPLRQPMRDPPDFR